MDEQQGGLVNVKSTIAGTQLTLSEDAIKVIKYKNGCVKVLNSTGGFVMSTRDGYVSGVNSATGLKFKIWTSFAYLHAAEIQNIPIEISKENGV